MVAGRLVVSKQYKLTSRAGMAHLFPGSIFGHIQHTLRTFFYRHTVGVVDVNDLEFVVAGDFMAIINERLCESQYKAREEQQTGKQQPFIAYLALFPAIELYVL